MAQGFRFGRVDGGAHATVVGVGTTQTGAAPITAPTNNLTSEVGQTAFLLPDKHPAGSPIVCFVGTVAALIFPSPGGKINGGAVDASFSATAAKSVILTPLDDSDSDGTNWFATLSA